MGSYDRGGSNSPPRHEGNPEVLQSFNTWMNGMDADDDRMNLDQVNSLPKEDIGMTAEVSELYRADADGPWDENIPDNIVASSDESPYFQKYALIVRRQREQGKTGFVLHSITIQSPLLRKVLDETFEGYEGLSTKLRELKFKAPLHEFYYRWPRFEKLCREEEDPDTKHHLSLLHPIVSREILPHIGNIQDLTQNGLISFEYLWAIFPPGMEVYSKVDGQDQQYIVLGILYGHTPAGAQYFQIRCRHIDCDGSQFGYLTTSETINEFQGVIQITDLNVFPSHLHPNPELLLEKLHRRGKMFEKLNGFHHVEYSGFYLDRTPNKVPKKRHTHRSRLIVDPGTFSFYVDEYAQPMNSIPVSSEDVREDEYMMMPTRKAFLEFEELKVKYEKKEASTDGSRPLSAKQRLLCAPVVKGFCLASKTWGEFFVENIEPINWSHGPFENLVLADGKKEIIHAFVQEQLDGADEFDDIVQGKGMGFIMLLSGEPGVGKTLTAEAVAEEMQKPLYSISAGELGETAPAVEESLQSVLELTAKWGAILLLDECDIFLEKRTKVDIQRNRLVSIFLRQLEYYRGAMFLTTNRAANIDPAFESRIHLSLYYPALDFNSRFHVWKNFVKPQGLGSHFPTVLTDSELETLAAREINGRQIKNAVKTARLFAKKRKEPLSLEHVEMVLKVMSDRHAWEQSKNWSE